MASFILKKDDDVPTTLVRRERDLGGPAEAGRGGIIVVKDAGR
jgi:hypothetical protein